MKKRVLALLLASMLALALAACGNGGANTSAAPSDTPTDSELKAIPKDELKVGFVYIGDINDGGYTQGHDKGRLALEEMGISCLYKENVQENADCETAVRELIDQGCNVVYATSFGHMTYVANVAKEHPDIYFGHATGNMTSGNLCNYMGRVIEARYLTGIVAGLSTEGNKIGYVAAKPIPEVIRGINAFTLGVRSVNPDATVEVIWTDTWYDVAKERQAAVELLGKGVDVLAQHQDSTACQLAAQEAGALCIGYNTPTPDAAPKAYLTAALFNWAKFYTDNVQSIMDGTWQPASYWEGLKAGWVDIDELSALCPAEAQEKVDAAKQAMIDGSLVLFSGDVKDQSGEVKETDMSDEAIYNMTWFIEGVVGAIPQ
ncbi:MAG: BMP family ABC transporter substrate-binding protein [Oscillospiraceae bacterium]